MIEIIKAEIIKNGVALAKEFISKKIYDLKKNPSEEISTLNDIDNIGLSAHRNMLILHLNLISVDIEVNEKASRKSIKKHQDEIYNWAENIFSYDLNKYQSTKSNYSDLNVYLIPRRDSMETNGKKVSISEKIVEEGNVIIVGQPGSGKTTTVKKIIIDNYRSKNSKNIILVRCREISFKKGMIYPVIETIAKLLEYKLSKDIPDSVRAISRSEVKYDEHISDYINYASFEAMTLAVNEISPIVIIDGIDELSSNFSKTRINKELKILPKIMDKSKIIVTSRTGEINYNIDGFSLYEIAPLDKSQIVNFVSKRMEGKRVNKFLDQLYNSSFHDVAMRPLTLSHLCAVYELTKKLPEKPRYLYKKIVHLLVEKWDALRDVERATIYSKLETEQKIEILMHIAYHFSVEIGTYVVTSEGLDSIYGKISRKFQLKMSEKKFVLNEIESTTGLFVQSGQNSFEFSHKSIHEYLAAEYISKLGINKVPSKNIEGIVSELAVAVSISPDTTSCIGDLLRSHIFGHRISRNFYYSFINELYLQNPNMDEERKSILYISIIFSRWITGASSDAYSKSSEYFDKKDFDRIYNEGNKFPPFEKLIEQQNLSGEFCNLLDNSHVIKHYHNYDVYKIVFPKGYFSDRLIDYPLFFVGSYLKKNFNIDFSKVKGARQ